MPHQIPKKQAQKIDVEFKRVAGELVEFIAQLQDMQRYASEHGFKETAKHLKEVMQAVSQLQTHLVESPAVSYDVEKIRISIARAKSNSGVKVESEQFFSLLRASKSSFQIIFDHMRNFFEPRNKLEIFLDEKLRSKFVKREAKNQLLFFQHSSAEKSVSPPKIESTKKQFGRS